MTLVLLQPSGNAEELTGGNDLCLILRAEVGPFRRGVKEVEETLSKDEMI